MTSELWALVLTNIPTAGAVFLALFMMLRYIEKRDDRFAQALDALTLTLTRLSELVVTWDKAREDDSERIKNIQTIMSEHEKDVRARPCIYTDRGEKSG